MLFKKWGFICLLATVFFSTVRANASTYSQTEAQIIPQYMQLSRQQNEFLLLVKITPKNGWHIYWNNPGDTGLPTKVGLTGENISAVLMNQTAPKYFNVRGIISQYAYDDSAYWLFKINVDQKNQNDVSIQLNAMWQACQEECLTEKYDQTLIFPLKDAGEVSPFWEDELLIASSNFPQQGGKGTYKLDQNILHAEIENFDEEIKDLKFIPEQQYLLKYRGKTDLSKQDNSLKIDAEIDPEFAPQGALPVILSGNGKAWTVMLRPQNPALDFSFIGMLAAAFVGGLILNLMPCIFPILFLKALTLIKSTEKRSRLNVDAILYFCGVICCFLIISCILWLLRRGGESLGWGFQLQSPAFVAGLCILFIIIGLMLSDVVHCHLPILNRLAEISCQNDKLNAFLTGLVAVLIASPCSAPFMGTALGYALLQPFNIYLPIFLALAVGYALPFTLLGLFPTVLARMLPKPGRWMVTLKRIFAIPVFITALWLGWIFYHQVVSRNIPLNDEQILWQAYDAEQIAEIKAEKRPVFIDFTAKWCLTCLLNEQTALASDEFKQIVKQKGIALFKADWTLQNETITQALESYGRNSVPLYVYYDGYSETPKILPQILTKTTLQTLIK